MINVKYVLQLLPVEIRNASKQRQALISVIEKQIKSNDFIKTGGTQNSIPHDLFIEGLWKL